MKFSFFSGHGDPMIALRYDDVTKHWIKWNEILSKYGIPKSILSISIHWYVNGTYIQSVASPKQIYDMYGFPKESYKVIELLE